MCTIFDLPSEVRRQIFSFALLEPHRLAVSPLSDLEWSKKTPERRGCTPLFLVSRQFYQETVELFYSRAILELAPPIKGHNYFDIFDKTGPISYGYTCLSHQFKQYRTDHLRLIRRVYVFSDQRNVIDGECYEATLQWLAKNTDVENINVSRRAMTRIGGKARFDLQAFRVESYDNLRVIRIWAKGEGDRSPWERELMRSLQYQPGLSSLKPAQIYFSGFSHNSGIQLDPRWYVKRSQDAEVIRDLAAAAAEIDHLMTRFLVGKELDDYCRCIPHVRRQTELEETWVAQMLIVPSPSEVSSIPRISKSDCP